MGGDHKCPVCSATFTRPQHVVRHMRSHTGDRPYKCQHCGDQFSRSDLLSRHINKCHVGEKLPGGAVANDTHGRRKGLNANATRATTSKQACDQCVQSSLPCDGCNPCAKCVQRKIRCTFVKFHRQTAPIGPGHNRSGNPSSPTTHHPSPPHQQVPTFNSASTNAYGPVYGSYNSSVGSLNYPTHHTSDDDPFILHPAPGSSSYAANYRAQQSDLHRRASLPSFPVPGQPWIGGWHENGETGEGPNSLQFNVDTGNHFAFNVGSDYRQPHQPPYSHQSHHQHHSNSHPHASSTTSLNSYSSSSSSSHDGSRPGTASDTSSVIDDPPSRPGTSSSFTDSLSGSRPGTSASGSLNGHSGTSEHSGNAGFSNAFGLLSLDDPAVIAGLATDGAPFFRPNPTSTMTTTSHQHQQQQFPRGRPSTGHGRNSTWGPNAAGELGTPGRETETRELREFWKAYMRTPLSGPGGTAGGVLGAPHPDMHLLSPGGNNSSTSPYRRQRVSSLPSVKTPTAISDEDRYAAGFNVQYPAAPGNAATTMHTHTNAEDLRSYEAAVLARKAPLNLSM
ncbi:hypothetical protein EV360DRAFT_27500, partial [Lentinula raphanica]